MLNDSIISFRESWNDRIVNGKRILFNRQRKILNVFKYLEEFRSLCTKCCSLIWKLLNKFQLITFNDSRIASNITRNVISTLPSCSLVSQQNKRESRFIKSVKFHVHYITRDRILLNTLYTSTLERSHVFRRASGTRAIIGRELDGRLYWSAYLAGIHMIWFGLANWPIPNTWKYT